jgi:hypothetical protein
VQQVKSTGVGLPQPFRRRVTADNDGRHVSTHGGLKPTDDIDAGLTGAQALERASKMLNVLSNIMKKISDTSDGIIHNIK